LKTGSKLRPRGDKDKFYKCRSVRVCVGVWVCVGVCSNKCLLRLVASTATTMKEEGDKTCCLSDTKCKYATDKVTDGKLLAEKDRGEEKRRK